MKYIFQIIAIGLLIIGCSSTQLVDSAASNTSTNSTEPVPLEGGSSAHKYPKNIILMIGDGMGISQITAGLYSNKNFLHLEKFKNIGLHKNYSSDDIITDSAAGATAFSCGIKTYNGAIGVDLEERKAYSILEEAEKKGKATGLVTTSTIVHATPAAFIAHKRNRKMYEEIATDFLGTDIDVFIGGGKKFFDRRQKDNRNISKELEDKGYVIKDYFNDKITSIEVIPNQKFGYFTADEDPLPVSQGRDYLKHAARLAMAQLSANSNKGFFLMIEGAQIDWGGHANNTDYIVSELLEFDKVIGRVLNWAAKDQETLVIVTADHETGGLAINGGEMSNLETKYTSTYHTADLIPVFAFGPKSETFQGIYENTAIYDKMRDAFQFK